MHTQFALIQIRHVETPPFNLVVATTTYMLHFHNNPEHRFGDYEYEQFSISTRMYARNNNNNMIVKCFLLLKLENSARLSLNIVIAHLQRHNFLYEPKRDILYTS